MRRKQKLGSRGEITKNKTKNPKKQNRSERLREMSTETKAEIGYLKKITQKKEKRRKEEQEQNKRKRGGKKAIMWEEEVQNGENKYVKKSRKKSGKKKSRK